MLGLAKGFNGIVLFEPLIEPADDCFVPEDGICRFQDPVAFVGEVEKFAGDAPALESVEGRQALRIGYSEIQRSVDD